MIGNAKVEILMVEDNDYDAELSIRALKQQNLGNKIIRLKDGEEALDYLFAKGKFEDRDIRKKPKFILLDLKLPKVDGLEVLKTIRENENLEDIPVVMMTSSKEEKDMVESYKYGVNSYVVKPIDFEQFAESVKDVGLYWMLVNKTPNQI